MPDAPIEIKRYPNRRYYSRSSSKYVSLQQIEQIVLSGKSVEIRDSQSGEDLTRNVLTQIIMERQPEKMQLFPTDMLHFIVRSNDVMAEFMRDYFRHSLTYLDYLQRHGGTAANLARPMHWVKAWLDGITPQLGEERSTPTTGDEEQWMQRVEQLESRLRELESKQEP